MKLHKLVKAALQGNTWFSKQGFKELKSKDLLWAAWLAFVGLIAAAGFFGYYFLNLYRNLLILGIQMNQYELLFFYAVTGSWIFIFLTGIPLALSVMYYSKDIKLMLSLPIRASEIIISRFFILWLYVLPISLVLIGLASYVYADAVALSFELVLAAVIHITAGPVLPLSLSVIFVTFLAKMVNIGKMKTAFEVGGMFFSLALIVILNIFISRTFIDPDTISNLTQVAGLFKQLFTFLFPAAWVSRSFFPGAGVIPLFLSLLLYAVVFVLMLIITLATYINDVSKRIVIVRKRKKVRTHYLKQNPCICALLKREIHILFSNSTFIFQTVGEMIVFPILLFVFGFLIPREYMKEIIKLIPQGKVVSLIIFGICVWITCMNSLSSTSLSREGKVFALNLVIPVSGRDQIMAKLIIEYLFYFPVFMIDMAVLMILLKADALSLIYMIPGAAAFLTLAFIINITIDLKRPILKWTHPMQAVKNNLNVLLGIGFSFILVCALAFAGWYSLEYLKIDPFVFGSSLIIIIALIDILFFFPLFRFAEKQYNGGIQMD